jgi:predicted Zn-dependent peptidase
VRRFRLPNGLEVVLWPRPGFPSVTASLMFRGGRAASNPAGAEFFLDEILPLRYCGGLPSFRGIQISTAVLPDAAIELAQGGAENLSAILLSLAERAAAYRYDDWSVLAALQKETCADLSPEEERARLWREVLANGKRRLEQQRLTTGRSASRQATRAIGRALLSGTAYEPAPAADLGRITEGELEQWHASSRRPENAVLVMVGALDLAGAEALARGWFSSWRPDRVSRPPRTASASMAAAQPHLYRVTEGGVAQAQIVLGCRLSSATPAESAADQVLARLLARDLRARLREQLGATYGLQEDLLELKIGTTMLRIETDVARAHLARALAEMIRRLDALVAQAPSPSLLRKAQLDVFRELGGPASSERLVAQATRLLMLGQPLDDLDHASEAAARVSPEAVRVAAAACRRTLSVATAGDAAVVGDLSLPGFVVEELR